MHIKVGKKKSYLCKLKTLKRMLQESSYDFWDLRKFLSGLYYFCISAKFSPWLIGSVIFWVFSYKFYNFCKR